MRSDPVDRWRSQSAVTYIGASAPGLDEISSTVEGIRTVSQELVLHYMGGSDGSTGPIKDGRLSEVDTRFAEAMFARLLQRGPRSLTRARTPEERVVGCCRDFSVLFVAMARHKGIPARVRMGYATYFNPGWYIDHVIAEVWDPVRKRWHLVEPEITPAQVASMGFDPLDVPPEKFVTGPRAWLAARTGQADPEHFVVDPDLAVPYTRSWLSLRHHLVQDLAALNKGEMILWEQWGILNTSEPLQNAEMLDRLARDLSDPDCPVATLMDWAQQEGLRVPLRVTQYSPAREEPVEVDVSRVLEGMLRG